MKKKTVKASDVFTLAAQIIAGGESVGIWSKAPCCPAISVAATELGARRGAGDNLRIEFREIFMPRNKMGYDLWFGNTSVQANQDRRVLALLFMAEMVKGDEA